MRLLLTVFPLVGCVKVVDAPAALEDVAHQLFADQDDVVLLSAGLTDLSTWLAEREKIEDGYMLPTLVEADIADITPPPNTNLSDAIGALADAQSSATLQQHVDFVLLPDQTVVDPDDYSKFDRTFLEGGDCFGDGSCDRLVTVNDMVKTAAFGVTIPYVYFKDYQHVTFTDATGVERAAMVSRGWIEEEGWEELAVNEDDDPDNDKEPANGVRQSYTLDVFMDTDAGTVHRAQALWTETVLVIDDLVSDGFLEDQLISGLHDVFDDTDAAIDELGL